MTTERTGMKLNVLVVGTGSIGERQVRCFLATSRVTVGICEINDDLRNRTSSQYSLEDAFSSLNEALEMSWDAAVVATPAQTHIPISTNLAKAGVGLLIDLVAAFAVIDVVTGHIGRDTCRPRHTDRGA